MLTYANFYNNFDWSGFPFRKMYISISGRLNNYQEKTYKLRPKSQALHILTQNYLLHIKKSIWTWPKKTENALFSVKELRNGQKS